MPLDSMMEKHPKCELHVHLEGTVTISDHIERSKRHQRCAQGSSSSISPGGNESETVHDDHVDETAILEQRLRNVVDLVTFLDVFEMFVAGFEEAEDFADAVHKYARRVEGSGVVYAEVSFDPQAHLSRGVPLGTMLAGLAEGQVRVREDVGVSVAFIACFHREKDGMAALSILEDIAAHPLGGSAAGLVVGIGLDNVEPEGFPAKFIPLFARAKALGYGLTAHCDVDQPHSHAHIRACVEELGVTRIDHGMDVITSPPLVSLCQSRGVALNMCPTLMFRDIHGRQEFRVGRVRAALAQGLRVTVNSDDPGLMRGLFLGDVWSLVSPDPAEAVALARNSIEASFLPETEKQGLRERLNAFRVE